MLFLWLSDTHQTNMLLKYMFLCASLGHWSVHHFGPVLDILANTGWIAMKV